LRAGGGLDSVKPLFLTLLRRATAYAYYYAYGQDYDEGGSETGHFAESAISVRNENMKRPRDTSTF